MRVNGRLLGIARREKKRAEMELMEWADVTLETGVADDFRGTPGQRQVTVMSIEAWRRACADAGCDLLWQTRRANLLVEGLELCETADSVIAIGDLRLRVTGETDPCQRMEEAHRGLSRAMADEWRGGVCCRVMAAGRIHVGDRVELANG